MLYHTFCHIHGIGTKTEAKLWHAGVTNWADWKVPKGVTLSKRSRMELPTVFDLSLDALENGNPLFFTERLNASDSWRIFGDFRSTIAYIDIETTGLSDQSEITTIALYDGDRVYTYVSGINLYDFVEDINKYKVLVSYNGKSFDVPFIESYFNIQLPHAQIDLRFVLARLGFKGGLKGCEKQMGLQRGALDGVDGALAVYLWHYYQQHNDEKALETLLAYNIEDTVNLENLLVQAWNMNLEKTPFAQELYLDYPHPPQLIHQPDLECVEKVKREFFR